MSVARCMFICVVLCIRPCIHTLLFRVVKYFKIWMFKKEIQLILKICFKKKKISISFFCILLGFNGLLAGLSVDSLNVGVMLIPFPKLSTLFQVG